MGHTTWPQAIHVSGQSVATARYCAAILATENKHAVAAQLQQQAADNLFKVSRSPGLVQRALMPCEQ